MVTPAAPQMKQSKNSDFGKDFFIEFSKIGKYLAIAFSVSLFLFLIGYIDIKMPTGESKGSILHHISRITEISFGGASFKLDTGEVVNVKDALASQEVSFKQQINEVREEIKALANPNSKDSKSQQETIVSPEAIISAKISSEVTGTVTKGWIWIGNDINNLKITKLNGSPFTSISELQTGQKIVASTALRIRAEKPKDVAQGYFAVIQPNGVLLGGRTATIQGTPKSYILSDGKVQYWIPIQY